MRIILAYDPNSAWSVAEKLPQSRIPIVMDLDNSMVAVSRGKYRAAPKRARFEPTYQGHCEARSGGSRTTLLRQVEIGGALNPLPRESNCAPPRHSFDHAQPQARMRLRPKALSTVQAAWSLSWDNLTIISSLNSAQAPIRNSRAIFRHKSLYSRSTLLRQEIKPCA
jgi:hypothetical protein